MWKITIVVGALLTVLGIGFYLGTGAASLTALIPSGFGLILILLGAVAIKERLRTHALRVACALGLLGFLGGIPGFIGLAKQVSGVEIERPAAANEQAAMGVICLVFTVCCVKSFIAGKRKMS